MKAGSSLMRSPLTVVMVCPGGFGSAPGAGRDSARLAAGSPAAADGARHSGRLVDVLVVEDGLRSPRGLVVEIMLPADTPDVARVVAAEGSLIGGLSNGGRRKAIGEKRHRCTPRRGGRCVRAAALERVGLELIERKPRGQVRGQPVVDRL